MTPHPTWQQLRDTTSTDWGHIAGQLEQDILDAYSSHPQLVRDAIARIGHRYRQGLVRSPWAVLRTDITQAVAAHERAQTAPTDTTDRDKAAQRAEQWIRAAGIHFDRWSEVHDELFGSRGRLHPYRDDPALAARMKACYDSHRPRGIQTEDDELARAHRYRLSEPGRRWTRTPIHGPSQRHRP